MNATARGALRVSFASSNPSPPARGTPRTVSGGSTGTVLASIAWGFVVALLLVAWVRLTEALDDPLIATILLALPILVLAALLGGRRS